MKRGNGLIVVAALLAVSLTIGPEPSRGEEPTGLPSYLYDRGDGIPTSLFGTYVRATEFVFYPFDEYTHRSLMIELESALYSSIDFRKASNDTSAVPNRTPVAFVASGSHPSVPWRRRNTCTDGGASGV